MRLAAPRPAHAIPTKQLPNLRDTVQTGQNNPNQYNPSPQAAAVQLQQATAELARARGELIKSQQEQQQIARMRQRAEQRQRALDLQRRNAKERKDRADLLKTERARHEQLMREQYQQVKQLEQRAAHSQVSDVERKRELISTYKGDIAKLKSLSQSSAAARKQQYQQQIKEVRNAENSAVARQKEAAARRQQMVVEAKQAEQVAYQLETQRKIAQIQRINQQKQQIDCQIQRMAGAE